MQLGTTQPCLETSADFNALAVHAGTPRSPVPRSSISRSPFPLSSFLFPLSSFPFNEHTEALFLTSSFCFKSAADGAEQFICID